MAGLRSGRVPLVRFAQRLRERRKPVRIVEIDDPASADDRSSVLAFVLGGVTVAGVLTALIYYDGTRPGPREALTTGSTLTIERPAPSRLAG